MAPTICSTKTKRQMRPTIRGAYRNQSQSKHLNINNNPASTIINYVAKGGSLNVCTSATLRVRDMGHRFSARNVSNHRITEAIDNEHRQHIERLEQLSSNHHHNAVTTSPDNVVSSSTHTMEDDYDTSSSSATTTSTLTTRSANIAAYDDEIQMHSTSSTTNDDSSHNSHDNPMLCCTLANNNNNSNSATKTTSVFNAPTLSDKQIVTPTSPSTISTTTTNITSTIANSCETYTHMCEIKNTDGLLAIALKTIKLVKRNQLLQRRLAQLQLETSEFIQSVLANPENRHFRQKIQQQNGKKAESSEV